MFERLFSRFVRKESPAVDAAGEKRRHAETAGELAAINRVQAIIHFALDGTILDANENFLELMGYRLEEIKGQQHRMFAEAEYARSAAYDEFWARLRRGEFDRGEYKRFGKGGKEVWLLASYNPILDENGRVMKVIKFASDVTAEKLRNADFAGQMEAIDKVQVTIEFTLDGQILKANKMFLDLMGYTLAEVQGRHHSMFLCPGEEKTEEYGEFWRSLKAGRSNSRVFKRIRKNGEEVWIQASYNPIRDMDGKPFKVVKFASDLTALIVRTESTQTSAGRMAQATSEMSRSIEAITRNMEMSRDATGKIIETTTTSGALAENLLDSMKAMERIVGLIRGIAGRVNMLALNATIEAARAGEAGKGFAVVATEVKSLSYQTAKATDEISREIGSVQAISGKVAQSIQETAKGVEFVNHCVSGVSASVDEQNAVTQEISSHSMEMVGAVEAILFQARRGVHEG